MGYFSLFKNKHVRITLLNADQYEDILKTDSYNRYDILLETNDKRILIPKHSILVLMEHDGKVKQRKLTNGDD